MSVHLRDAKLWVKVRAAIGAVAIGVVTEGVVTKGVVTEGIVTKGIVSDVVVTERLVSVQVEERVEVGVEELLQPWTWVQVGGRHGPGGGALLQGTTDEGQTLT